MNAPEEKQEMTSLDLRFMVKELRKTLVGGVVRKIYQYGRAGSRQFLFEVYIPQQGAHWLYIDSNKLFITRHKKAAPQEPPSFCMFLRKHLMGRRIKGIRQYEFDRIVEIVTDDNVLVIELFSTGNLILCDSMYNIIMPLEFQKWKGREVKPKIPYKYPPKVTNPFNVDFDVMRNSMLKSDKNLVGFLATSMSLGPEYGREVCSRAGVPPEKHAKDVVLEEASKLFRALEGLGSEKPKPSLYSGFVSPFPLHMLSESPREAGNLSEAFDEFFSGQQIDLVKEGAVKHVTEEKEKAERIVVQQAQADEKWARIINESQEKANLIYNNYPTVQSALEGIAKAKSSGMEWSDIKRAVKGEQTPEAESIKEIREGDGTVIMELGGKDVELQFNKSVEENAARYYEDAKWAKRKLGGLGEAKEKSQARLDQAQAKEEKVLGEDFRKLVFPREKPAPGEEPEQDDSSATEAGGEALEALEPSKEEAPKKKRKIRWYERFRWFFSSDGFLVVAGKSAESNEVLLKRHTDPTDIVFHADIPGAAFVVIKSQGMEVTDVTKREAAEFSAANSKAWSRGLGTIDIFSVPRSKVSKSPPSGQYLPKGSFMVEGEREWYRNLELKLAVGVRVDGEANEARVVSGPVMAVRKHSDYFITLKPGLRKSLELARLMKNKILVKARPDDRYLIEQVPLEEFQVVVPSGMADVVEHAGEAV